MTMVRHVRFRDERGVALVTALLATMLLTALGMAVVLVSNTESLITGNHRAAAAALYAADAGIERAVQDLLLIPRWNDVLQGGAAGTAAVSAETSSFAGTSPTSPMTLPNGMTLTLCCDAASLGGQLQAESNSANFWGANNPSWRLYAWGPLSSLLPGGSIDSDMYVSVWVADDPSENDGNPLFDANGVLTMRAEAFGQGGVRKVVEVTVARTATTEIERGQIAQRGQEELNQRARKAAVQTPGKSLTRMNMNTATGGLARVP
jgi:hypothetical protein